MRRAAQVRAAARVDAPMGLVRRIAPCAAVLAALALSSSAHAATACAEPGADWQDVAPSAEGFDAAKLQSAIDYGTANLGFSLRVYRNGCRVGEDRTYPANKETKYESWSLAKSITSLAFGRAMTLGYIEPDDPLGSIVPEADAAHGAVTMRDLLTQSSGLRWNGFRDYDIAMPDRLRDGLTVPIVHPPGTFFEYSQSGPALVAEAVQRATGQDFQGFVQRELFTPLGIQPGDWFWTRDSAGHTQGFFGLNMPTDDFARLGELMRRGGMWDGRRLLSQRYVREAVTPSATNGCYGYLIWVNAAKPCIGPTITSRPVRQQRYFPDLPTDTFHFEGLFGQVVTVMPSLGIVVARNGVQTVADFAGGGDSEGELYQRILAALTDGSAPKVDPAGATVRGDTIPNPDEGFQKSLTDPTDALQPYTTPPLPAAGPGRSRALRLRLAHVRVSKAGGVTLRATCPAIRPGRGPAPCAGQAVLEEGVSAPVRYTLAPGATGLIRLVLAKASLAALRRTGTATYTASASTSEGGISTPSSIPVRVTG